MPPHGTWTSPPAAVYCRLIAGNTSLGKTLRLNLFSADFRSFLVARSRKPIKCLPKTLLGRSTHAAPVCPHKPNGSSCNFQQWHPCLRVCDCQSNSYRPGRFEFFGRDHISYCTTVRGPDILRNVTFSGYATFYQFNTFFVNVLHYFFIIGKMCFAAVEMAS